MCVLHKPYKCWYDLLHFQRTSIECLPSDAINSLMYSNYKYCIYLNWYNLEFQEVFKVRVLAFLCKKAILFSVKFKNSLKVCNYASNNKMWYHNESTCNNLCNKTWTQYMSLSSYLLLAVDQRWNLIS